MLQLNKIEGINNFFHIGGECMNHLLKPGPLLDDKGYVSEAGYHFNLVKEYNRKAIKTSLLTIKEWDYYYIGDEKCGLALTIADNGYMGLCGFSIMDFVNKKFINRSKMFWFPLGRTNMPTTSVTGDAYKKGSNYEFHFKNDNGNRHLIAKMNVDGKHFEANIKLNLTTPHSMVIVTPFYQKRRFYYNQKINLLLGDGIVKFGNFKYEFKHKFGVLDWGRGVWAYKNTWYWASASGEYQTHLIGFNLGYGFGNTSNASENMLFYDQEVYKLDDVKFNIPLNEKGKEEYLKPWTFTSSSGDINLVFEPVLNRQDHIELLILGSCSNQVFGKYSGVFKLKDKTIHFENIYGFAEKVKNRW